MKKDYLAVARAVLGSIIIVGIILPQLAGAANNKNSFWASLFQTNAEKRMVLTEKENQLPTTNDQREIVTLGSVALIQPLMPIGARKLASAPYCAYKPDTSYCLTTVTAYSSTVEQTDSSPFITANGSRVRDGIIACNFLPFGTEVRFPEIYGNKIFTVEDRMAAKNNHKMDIWFESTQEAIEFGVKRLRVEILN